MYRKSVYEMKMRKMFNKELRIAITILDIK
jgi:hypothetical protein